MALHQRTDARIEKLASEVTWIRPGEVSVAVEALRAAGVQEAVMAGKVPKLALLREDPELGLDRQGEALIAELSDRMADTILSQAADFLAGVGIRLLPQRSFSPELLAGEGALGRVRASAAQQRDIAFAFPIARQLGSLDIGQTVVVKDGAVLAVEAIEGTDAAPTTHGHNPHQPAAMVLIDFPRVFQQRERRFRWEQGAICQNLAVPRHPPVHARVYWR